MLPQLDVRHMYSVVVLAEELNFTRAAHRLRISQPAFSRHITAVEKQYGFQLVTRDRKRGAQLTEAGRMFVEEARSALLHADRAIQLARAAHHGHENVVLIGHPTHANHEWISTLLAIRLPLFPKLKVRLTTLFATELVTSVLASELHLALVTAPPSDAKLTTVAFAETRLCVVFSDTHAAAAKEQVTLEDFANDEWILLPRNVNATIHDTILEMAARAGIPFRQAHGVINAEQGFYLVSERAGVAILPMPSISGVPAPGVVVRPLCDPALSFETCLVMRRDDDSKLVNQYARAFLKRYVRKLGPSRQMDLPLSA